MNNRYLALLLCAAALAYACGPWAHSQGVTPATTTARVQHGKTDRGVATTLAVIPNGRHVSLALHVANNTPKVVELRFPNGMTHDFAVLDASGRTVWRWSQSRIFTQAMQSKTMHSRDSLTIDEEWDARNAHGTYTAVAVLNTTTHPVERRVAFTLP